MIVQLFVDLVTVSHLWIQCKGYLFLVKKSNFFRSMYLVGIIVQKKISVENVTIPFLETKTSSIIFAGHFSIKNKWDIIKRLFLWPLTSNNLWHALDFEVEFLHIVYDDVIKVYAKIQFDGNFSVWKFSFTGLVYNRSEEKANPTPMWFHVFKILQPFLLQSQYISLNETNLRALNISCNQDGIKKFVLTIHRISHRCSC